MDATAIQRIEQLISAASEQSSEMMAGTGHIPYAMLPSGMTVESLEHLQDRPNRLRQTYKTKRLDDFISYVTAEHLPNDLTAVYVLDGKALAIIDHGTEGGPLWGSHRAILELRHTPEFAALKAMCAGSRDQSALINYLEDWAIAGPVDSSKRGEHIPDHAAIAAIRKVEIRVGSVKTNEQTDFSARRTSMEEIEAKGAEDLLPDAFVLHAPVYVDTAQRQIHAKLILSDADGKPAFRLRILREDLLMDEVAREVERTLRETWQDVRVYAGSVERCAP